MIKPIIRDTFFLSQKSIPASREDWQLGQDLLDTLQANKGHCVGLAANMIGVNKRVIVISVGSLDLVMFNPELKEKSGPYQTEEGCLSLTGLRETRRYQSIRVAYLDSNWQAKTLTLEGFPAQICQHELDHLEGILI